MEGDQHDGSVVVVGNRTSGAPGTEVARRAAMVDGCTIIKVGRCCVVAAGVVVKVCIAGSVVVVGLI